MSKTEGPKDLLKLLTPAQQTEALESLKTLCKIVVEVLSDRMTQSLEEGLQDVDFRNYLLTASEEQTVGAVYLRMIVILSMSYYQSDLKENLPNITTNEFIKCRGLEFMSAVFDAIIDHNSSFVRGREFTELKSFIDDISKLA
jgi:hypothetical protein